jgi:hypothetical protein
MKNSIEPRRREVKREIDEERHCHIEQRTEENIAAGIAPEDATREARKRLSRQATTGYRLLATYH